METVMKHNILKAILYNKQNYVEDEREMLEFNSTITFCFKFLVVSLVTTSFFYKPFLTKYVHEEAICLYLIGITSFIGAIKLCNKGIIVLNKNHQILYPVFLFFPFFPLKVIVVISSLFHIYIPTVIRISLTFIFLIGIYLIINKLYLNGIERINSVDEL